MATTAIATLHPLWDCRWNRPGHRFIAERGEQPRETHWVCVREKEARPVLQQDCSACTHWEPRLAVAPGAALTAAPIVFTASGADAATRIAVGRLGDIGTRAVLVLIAVGIFVIGFTQLTSVMAVPFVIAFWLGGAALLGIVAFVTLDGNAPPFAESGSHTEVASHAGTPK
jgi:hypothetical protein